MFNKVFILAVSIIFTFCGAITSAQASDSHLQKRIEVKNPVIFQLAEGAKGTGSKMTIYNNSDEDLIIEGFTSDVFKMTMLHGVKYESGKRIMFEIDKVTIVAHKKLALTPNTHHLMMFGPLRKLVLNEFLTLRVKSNQGEFDIIAKVVPRRLK